ncbi:MAG: ThuA domain-containing protein, partial [Verrucomicrobiota bacterium]
VLEQFKAAKDPWTQSALIAAAAEMPLEMIQEALHAKDGALLGEFVAALVAPALSRENGGSQLVNLAALAPESSVELQNLILKGIAEKGEPAPQLSGATLDALKKLLGSAATSGAALPVVGSWDKAGVLREMLDAQLSVLLTQFADVAAPVRVRTQAAVNLLPVIRMSGKILPALSEVLLKEGSDELKQSVLEALGQGGRPEAGPLLMAAYRGLGASLQGSAFNQLIKRAEWTKLLLDGIQTGGINVGDLGPANVARLRTHPDKAVSQLANKILNQAGSPRAAEKNKVLAALTPEVEKGGGDVEKGKALFSAACATCHKIGNLGNQVGPLLDGMGAHSIADLLVAIVDPNREVDPSFYAWNVVKKNGEVLVGVIGQENTSTLQLRSPAGTVEIPKDQIATRENTQRSLMPEGFDGLGAENLRHLMAFLKSTSVPAPVAASAPMAGAPKPIEPLPASGASFPDSIAPGVSRILLVGGGSSHDFEKFFNQADAATLQAKGKFVTAYTPNAAEAIALLAKADVLVLSANHKSFGEPDFQNALRAFADSGKGLVMVHAAVWYNWAPVSGFNRRFIGGGSRSHGKGDFQVLSKGNGHPVLDGVPAEFTIYDENYRVELDPEAPVDVLAMTSVEASSNKAFPSVWVVKDPKTRIVAIALGHDNAAHSHDAYQKLLVNAVNWTAKK